MWALVYRVHSDAQAGWHREQTANPVREVGASTVVFVFVCERVCDLVLCDGVPQCETVVLVFCDMLEYLLN